MRKQMKRLISILLVVMSFTLIIGCGGTKEPTHPTAIPSYEAYKQTRNLELLAFWSPPPTYQHYEWVKECGFTSIVIDAKYDCSLRTGQSALEPLKNAISYCSAVGLDGYITVNRGEYISDKLTDEFKNEEGFAGIYTDEPITLDQMDIIADNVRYLKTVYPDKEYSTTLTGIGGLTIQEVIDNYIERVGDKVKWVNFDFYPLIGRGNSSEIASDWLWVLDTYAKTSVETGIKLMSYIATMSYTSGTRRRPNEADLRYQSYVNLAYGAKGIAHFCYNSPGIPPFDGEFSIGDYALLLPDYEDLSNYENYTRTATWYSAQKVNEEISSFANVYLSYDWVGTICNKGTDSATTAYKCFGEDYKNQLLSHERVKSFSSTEDMIIGCMKDNNGYDGFMVVNFSDPYYKKSNSITIDFDDAQKAVVYVSGEKKIEALSDGRFTTTLNPGEGIFIIPIA